MQRLAQLPPGTELTGETFNRIIDAINGAIIAGASAGLGGQRLSLGSAGSGLGKQPAFTVRVVNRGDHDIPTGGLCGFNDGRATRDEDFIRPPSLNIRRPQARHAGNFLIAKNPIRSGGLGEAFVDGACYCRVIRWWNSDLLDTVEVLGDKTYGLATVGGSADIVWEQRNEDGTHIIDEVHWAIVQFNRRRFIPYKNTGAYVIRLGDPAVPDIDDTGDSGLVDDLTAPAEYQVAKMASPQGATLRNDTGFVNVGGDVQPGEIGRCFLPFNRTGLIKTEDPYHAGNLVGPVAGRAQFTTRGDGLRVLARLAYHDGYDYAIVTESSTSAALMMVRITGGNTLASGQAGVKLVGTMTEVASLWDPDDPGIKEDGIGTAVLYRNGVSLGNVLVLNDGRAGITSGLVISWRLQSPATVRLPLAGDPTQSVLCYIPAAA
jgi:hypothetical protein